MIRVLHIIGKMDRAGAETMLMNLYRHMDREIIQFDFITFTNQKGDYDDEILALGGKIFPIIANNPFDRAIKLTQFLKKHPEYEVVHAHMLLNNAFHLLAAMNAGVQHRISHAHSSSNGQVNIVKKIYEKWALTINRKVATYKIGCGKLAAEYLFGTTKDVLLLNNAVNIDGISAIARESSNYINNKFCDDGLKIIHVGRLTDVKNHQFSLEIAKELMKRQVRFTLYIIGRGSLQEKLHQQVVNEQLSHHVKFLGLRIDITELMASADYMILPSLHEGFPVVLVESQSVGLKAIVSNRVSSEVDLGLGLVHFLPISSAEEWADCLLEEKSQIISKNEIANTLKSKGFDVNSNAQRLAELYISL